MDEERAQQSQHREMDWHRLMLRKQRPLPKAGCSWAFYIVLLLLVGFLVWKYIHFKQL